MRGIFSNRPCRSRIERRAFAAVSCIPIIYGFTILALNRFNIQLGAGWMWMLLIAITLLFFGLIALGLIERAKTRRLLSETNCRLCLNCRYVLSALPNQGICPECGESYELQHLIAEWRDAYRVP